MTSQANREFDPNRKYPIVLSERLKNWNGGGYSLSSIQVDTNLKIPSKVRSSRIKRSGSDDEHELEVVGATDGKIQAHSGTKQASKSYVLIFDPAAQSFTLDKVDASYSFGNDQSGDRSQSEDGVRNALIEEEGEADQDNPYDWRHQLTRSQSTSPELEAFDPLSLDALESPSPERQRRDSPVRARRESYRQASTPPGEISARSSPSQSPSPEPEPEHEEPEEPEENGFELEIEQDSQQKRGRQNYDEVEEESDASSVGDALEIIEDGASRRRVWNHRGRLGQALDGPISLRSAATSRSPGVNNMSGSESDDDVDEYKLGSPRQAKPTDEAQDEVQDEVQDDVQDEGQDEGDVDMDDDFDNLEHDLEVEFGGGIPIGPYVDADSSSESEEE